MILGSARAQAGENETVHIPQRRMRKTPGSFQRELRQNRKFAYGELRIVPVPPRFVMLECIAFHAARK
jgi:hypothetical protein